MKWRTLDGRVLSPEEMETDHIKNCLAMLARRGYVSANTWLAMSNYARTAPDGAAMCVESELARLVPSSAIDIFEKELKKRNVKLHTN